MKICISIVFLLLSFGVAFGQDEQSPIVEKDVQFKNWEYKNVKTGEAIDLRKFVSGKKLVLVVYFAPWCPNWKHDAPILERFYEKYKGNGLDVIGVGEYDTVAAVNTGIDALKVAFQVVSESESRDRRLYTLHYGYRQTTGDMRKWGSPWYIFLDADGLEKKGDVLLTRANVINGEIIEGEGERFIRQKLGLPAEETKTAAKKDEIEVCDPDNRTTQLKKP